MTLPLVGKTREEAGKVKPEALRKLGFIPAVVYGHGIEPYHVVVAKKDFLKVLAQAGESTLVDLTIGQAKPVKVIIQEVQRDSVTNEIIHLDLHQVKMDEKVVVEVPLTFTGEAKAVKELAGVLVKTADHVKVECLPDALISEISVDLSGLATFEDRIVLADLKLPAGVKILGDLQETVALVEEPRAAEAEQPVTPAAAATPTETKTEAPSKENK